VDQKTATPDTGNVVIRVSELKKSFGDLMAVDGLSFNVRQGEIFGFLGPNGAGKTTAINMICGLSEPTAGEILILGHSSGGKQEVKTHIGICPQDNIHWPKLTCYEQLTFMGEIYSLPGHVARRRSQQLLEWMGLEEKSNVLAGKLSGGMKRRLNICLALIHDPEILILDEPEVGLDPQSRVLVRNTIKALAQEKTIILTTHNMDEADRLAHRVAIIDHGRLLLLDTPENLKKSIGEGDVVEITLDLDAAAGLGLDPAAELDLGGERGLQPVVESLLEMCDQVNVSGATLIVKSRNLIELVSDITALIKGHGFGIKGIALRENTLEDVFIHLTGRKLRQ
jgi:ABC-2 type transport system ATP-binding protein